tara:strand:- start:662 stop:880 length:219 start_codon:yes stop_codon:yes gene_type:complete
MAEKVRKYKVPYNVNATLGAGKAANLIKDSLENYQKAQKTDPKAKDGNYDYLELDYLVWALNKVLKQVQGGV